MVVSDINGITEVCNCFLCNFFVLMFVTDCFDGVHTGLIKRQELEIVPKYGNIIL